MISSLDWKLNALADINNVSMLREKRSNTNLQSKTPKVYVENFILLFLQRCCGRFSEPLYKWRQKVQRNAIKTAKSSVYAHIVKMQITL